MHVSTAPSPSVSFTIHNMGFKFLVVGAGRSGTSLVAALLDGHPKLELGFEQDSEMLLATGEPSTSRAMRFRNRCQELAAEFPSKQWGNKITTEQIEGLENGGGSSMGVVQHFFADVMRDIVKIVVVRDGRTCVRSKLERNPQLTMEEACRRWRYSIFVHDWLVVQRSHVVSLRYEDLLHDAKSALLPACACLGIDWDDAMLAGTNSPKLLPEYRQQHIGLARPVVDDPLPRSMATIEVDLRRLGYI